MFHHEITPADQATVQDNIRAVRAAQEAERQHRYTREDCAAIIGDTAVNYGALGHATSDQLADRLYAILSAGRPAKRVEEVRFADLETPAAYRARKARERGL